MATPKAQRIGIWIIAIVLSIGTLGSFLAMGLSASNKQIDQNQQQNDYTDYQNKVNTQAQDLSAKYYGDFSQYSSIPATFNAGDVKDLVKTDLKIGDGEELTANTEYSAYYIGWNPTGKIFDQSISDGSLKAPLPGGDMISGWNDGILGMKMGGVRELTIPSDQAYGPTERSADIPANTPLKFIVMAIPKPADVPLPESLQNIQ